MQLDDAVECHRVATKAEVAQRGVELAAVRQQLDDATSAADCMLYLLDEGHASQLQVSTEEDMRYA